MTEQFYKTFLDYITQKERRKLYGNLEKNKFCVNGFRMKTVPAQILSAYISKEEKRFFSILKKNYKSTYATAEEALDAFSPETAVECLTLVYENNCVIDEQKLMQLMHTTEDKPTVELHKGEVEFKTQKKAEEFRRKYLNAYKILEKTRQENEELKSQICQVKDELQKEILSKSRIIEQLEQKIATQEAQINKQGIEYEKAVRQFKIENEQLTREISKQKEYMLYREEKILVLSDRIIDLCGVSVLRLEQVDLIAKDIRNYTEVVFVVNDIPFSIKRRINKIREIADKIHTFSTYTEMIEYLEKRGHK